MAMRSGDAVLVVPGIMGSELVDTTTGSLLWGFSGAGWYVDAWTSGRSLRELALTDTERDGRYGRVAATRLLRFPAYAPVLRGFEPYGRLLAALRATARHPSAVAEFAYDWRLPVSYNAGLLADAAARHLGRWRQANPGAEEPQLVVVAHSMGGLLAQHLSTIPGGTDGVRACVTLGTPFFGAPKAAVLLAQGRGIPLPLPRRRAQALAASLPGVYDLLPSYRCVDTVHDVRRLTPADIAALGGDAELAARAAERQASVSTAVPAGHVQVVGARQPTIQTLTLDGDQIEDWEYTCRREAASLARVDVGGDGTVPRESAQLPASPAFPLAQTHGALARTAEAILVAQDVMLLRGTGPWLGEGRLGLRTPDLIPAGDDLVFSVLGADRPRHVNCRIESVRTGRTIAVPSLRTQDDRLVALVPSGQPGLYRISVAGGGMSPVTEIVMVADPDPVAAR